MKSNLMTLLPAVIILLGILPSSTLGRAQGQTSDGSKMDSIIYINYAETDTTLLDSMLITVDSSFFRGNRPWDTIVGESNQELGIDFHKLYWLKDVQRDSDQEKEFKLDQLVFYHGPDQIRVLGPIYSLYDPVDKALEKLRTIYFRHYWYLSHSVNFRIKENYLVKYFPEYLEKVKSPDYDYVSEWEPNPNFRAVTNLMRRIRIIYAYYIKSYDEDFHPSSEFTAFVQSRPIETYELKRHLVFLSKENQQKILPFLNDDPISLSKEKDERNGGLTYDSILDEMNDISNRGSSTEEDMALYIIIYLRGLKLKYELDKFTYLLECYVSEDGSMQNVIIKNSEIEGSNDQCIIDYLMKMPRCEFWNSYSGTDKDSITIINIPLHF